MTIVLHPSRVFFAFAVMLAALAAPSAALATKKSNAFCSANNVDAYLDQTGSYVDKETGKRVRNVVDIDAFYAQLRVESKGTPLASYFKQSSLTERRNKGTDGILRMWNEKYHLNDHRPLAYVLATAWHETATRMSPVRETLANTDAEAIRRLQNHWIKRGRRGHYYWHIVKETERAYFGRGHVQLTWDDNYKIADRRLGREARDKSIYWQPDFALDPEVSALITFDGMMYGWYRKGRCIPLFFKGDKREPDWRGARDIVNGDVGKNGRLIQGYAVIYAAALAHPGVIVTEEALEQRIAAREQEKAEEQQKKEEAEQQEIVEEAQDVAAERRRDNDRARMGKIETDLIELSRRLDKLDADLEADDADDRGEIQKLKDALAQFSQNAAEQAEQQDLRLRELESDVVQLQGRLNATYEAVVALRGALAKRDEALAAQLTRIENCTGLWSSVFGCDTGE